MFELYICFTVLIVILVCSSGEEISIASIVRLWHRDRKNWWPDECFPAQCQVTHVDAYIDNKTLVCFILESKKHPFVVNMLAIKEGKRQSNLQSLIKQLKKSKSRFDSLVKTLLDSTAESTCVSLSEIPATNSPNVEVGNIITTPAYCKSPKIATDYPVYMAGTLPINKRCHEQVSIHTLNTRENCLSLYQLPIIERLSIRYSNKKKSEGPNNQREENSSSDSEDQLVEDLVASRNKYRPCIGAKTKKKLLEAYQMNRNTPRMTPPPSDIHRTSDSSSEDEAYHTRITYSPTNDLKKLRCISGFHAGADPVIPSSPELEDEEEENGNCLCLELMFIVFFYFLID